MTQASTRSQIKLNRRGLTELVLACAFLSLATFALWSWQNHGGYVTAMDSAVPAGEAPLLPHILRDPAIMLSTVVTEFVLLLAILLSVAPLSWWLRTDVLVEGETVRVVTPLRWAGEKLHILHAPEPSAEFQAQGFQIALENGQNAGSENANGQNVNGQNVNGQNVNGQTVYVTQPGAPQQVIKQEVVTMEQPETKVMVVVQQQNGTTSPATSPAGAPGTAPNATPDATKPQEQKSKESKEGSPPAPPLANVLNFEETQEEDPLADLADIGDILSSAFDEDMGIDPDLEAISRSLDDVDIRALVKSAQLVLSTFRQQPYA